MLTLTMLASLLVALALGGMVFFAAVYAPVIFRTLAPEPAGRLLRALFPVYYKVNAGLTGAAALSLALRPEGWLLAAICALFLVSMVLLMPRINQARDLWLQGDQGARRRFNRLHRASVAINVVQMVVLVGVFLRLAG